MGEDKKMALVKKEEFIEKFLTILKRDLENDLPNEDFEYEMLVKAWGIVYKKINHIKNIIKEV